MEDLRNSRGSNITMDAMDEELNGSQVERKQKESFFDAKNYLNVKLGDKEETKELKIRLLPIDGNSQTPFKKIHVHTVKVPKEISANGWKSYICLEKTEGIDHEKYGKKCPFCELNREAYKHFTEETDEFAKERWKKISLANVAKEACVVRCIERGAELHGPKFWKFNTRKDKTDPKGQIIELYKTRLEESREEGLEDENILDVRTGKDLKVTISLAADAKGVQRTSVNVVDYGKNKPLSNDDEELIRWINDEKKWSDVFAIKSYDYLRIVLDGNIPFFDRNVNQWVTKTDSITQNNDNEEEYNNAINEAIDEFTMISNPDSSVQENSELPF